MEKQQINIIRYATIFSFWTMLVLWEIEAMRLIGKVNEFESDLDFNAFMGLVQFDSTMVLVTIFTFISSAFYFYIYDKKWFGLTAIGFSVLFLMVVVLK